MDKSAKKSTNEANPRITANPISIISFWWLINLVCYGRNHDITAEDLYDPIPTDLSEPLGVALEKSWHKELANACKSNKKPSFRRAVVKTYGTSFLKYTNLLVAYVITILLQPLALEYLMLHFYSPTASSNVEAYLYAAALVLLMLSTSALLRHAQLGLFRLGMRVSVACSALMYGKILRLSCSATNRDDGASIINLMTNDLGRFSYVLSYLPFTILAPLQLIMGTCLMWRYVGVAALVGVLLMVLQTLPLQVVFYKVTHKLRKKLVAKIDERILLTNEVITGIRTVKMYVWEKPFENLVHLIRSQEIKYHMKIQYIEIVMSAIYVFAYRLSVFFTFFAYGLTNGIITAAKIVPVNQYLFTFRTVIGVFFSCAIRRTAEVNVSLKRIETFLLLPEAERNNKNTKFENDDLSVSMKNVIARWDGNSSAKVLQDINVDIHRKKLHAIVGSVGSGKSTFLKLILQELQPISGQVFVHEKVSYASQEPWLFAGSIQDNIVFGEKYDEEKYNRITKACDLLPDFAQFPYGDKTLVGDRGINLSGGQRARINLARAVYRDADLYLLDDPFSAVDAQVAKKIFEECINGLLKDKTRILVTHNVHHLMDVDTILLLNRGMVDFQGSFPDFQKNNVYLGQLSLDDESGKTLTKKIHAQIDNEKVTLESIEDEDEEDPKETEELLSKGRVGKSLYWKFIQAGGSASMLLLLGFSYIPAILSTAGFDYWLVIWTRQEEAHFKNISNMTDLNFISSNFDRFSYAESSLYISGALILLVIITTLTKNILFFKVLLSSTKSIHNKMFSRLIRTPLRFFSVNPAGRILNRFSKDTGTVDQEVVVQLFDSVDEMFHVLAVIIPIFVVNFWMFFPMAIIAFLIFKLSVIYVSVIQSIKRVEGNAKSPVLSLAVSSLAGLLTIRSSEACGIVRKTFDSFQNRHTAAFFMYAALTHAFVFWVELFTTLVTALVTYGYLILANNGILASDLGLILMQLLTVSSLISYPIKQLANSLGNMANVERMFQYTKLEQEESEKEVAMVKPPKTWPDRGELIFKNLCLKYSEDGKPALNNLNLAIEPRAKIGIVGRTGAGKSSLISALFRLANIDGSLLIDDLDIKKLSLSDLRSKISIIPQEPILFSASLRNNLDPMNESDDTTLWSALQDVRLNKTFDSLDRPIDRGGSNLSSGQRQLLCLARAIIKKNKILVLDEATASVDPATDALIQKTIRMKFTNCTVLTIAHRLNTVMDSDKILVMDNGEVAEFDHPYLLLQRNDGLFSIMVQQTGNAMAQHLKTIAETAYRTKNIKA